MSKKPAAATESAEQLPTADHYIVKCAQDTIPVAMH